MLDAVEETLAQYEGTFGAGLDVCCGTGAGIAMLHRLCRGRVTGVDLSAGMLAEAERRYGSDSARVDFVRADARALPPALADGYDLAVSFGAFGHFLPSERPALFAGIHSALREGGLFAFPIGAPLPLGSPVWWATTGFDAAMRVRNAVWRPRSSCTTAPSRSAGSARTSGRPASRSRRSPWTTSAAARTAPPLAAPPGPPPVARGHRSGGSLGSRAPRSALPTRPRCTTRQFKARLGYTPRSVGTSEAARSSGRSKEPNQVSAGSGGSYAASSAAHSLSGSEEFPPLSTRHAPREFDFDRGTILCIPRERGIAVTGRARPRRRIPVREGAAE